MQSPLAELELPTGLGMMMGLGFFENNVDVFTSPKSGGSEVCLS